MIRSKKLAITSLIVVFISGLFCGILAERLYFHQFGPHKNDRHIDKQRPSLVEIFNNELQLNSDQTELLKSMLDDIKSKHEELRQEQRAVYDSLHVAFHENFRARLNPEQQIKFDKMRDDFQKRQKSRER